MRYDHRPHKSRLTADEAERVRGIGVVIPPPKRRNLYDVRPTRHTPVDRSVTVTTADGRVRVLNSRMRTLRANRVTVKEPPQRKRTQFAVGAQYAETWANKGNVDHSVPTPEHWFRGVKYESQAAIEAYINSL